MRHLHLVTRNRPQPIAAPAISNVDLKIRIGWLTRAVNDAKTDELREDYERKLIADMAEAGRRKLTLEPILIVKEG